MVNRKLLLGTIIGALLPLLAMNAQAADPDSATVYEVQQGVYSQFTFVTIDSVVVTGVGTSFFYVAEQGGGPYNGIYVTTGATPGVGQGDLVTIGGFYFESTGNSIISASSGAGGFVTVQTFQAALPQAQSLTIGDVNTGAGTAEEWEGCLVTMDTVQSVVSLGGGEWNAIEIDGDAPGETLLVTMDLISYTEPTVGDTIVKLTGLMNEDSGLRELHPRSDLDVLVADAIAPSDITDLAAITGEFGGEVDLTWTTTGDDTSYGYANNFIVRYNTVPVTGVNWATSNDVAGEPLPDTSGTSQMMTVTNLTPGTDYYFAIRVQDEFGNISNVSNSPNAIASTNPEFAFAVVFGNFHSHTAASDGIGNITQAYTYARDTANIDVLSVTDHSHYLTSGEYTSLLTTANTFTEDGVFVALAGQEMGIANSSGYGHMSVWNASQVAPTSAFTNMTNAYNFFVTENVPGGYNHPEPMNSGSNFNDLAFVFQYDKYVNTIEVRNGKRSGNYNNRYLQALSNGWHIGAVGNQDNHNGLWGDQQNPNSGNDIYLTGLLVTELTTDGVMDAFWNRRTYACEINPVNDRVNLLYRAGPVVGTKAWMGEIDTIATTEIELELEINAANDFQTIQIYRNAVFYDSELVSGNDLTWTYLDTVPTDPGDYYYHLRIIQADQDATWTSPIWFHVDTSVPTDVATGSVPGVLALHENSPNPFNPTTQIRFDVPKRGRVSLEVYDISGRLVRTLVDQALEEGTHTATWTGTDNIGNEVGSGLYFYRISAGGKTISKKMMLMR